VSWDIFVQDLPPESRSVSEIPDDFQPKPIGERRYVIATIERLFPEADFTDPGWGRIDSASYSIEVNLGESETLSSFAFHIRGNDEAAYVVAEILEALRLRAIDPGSETGIFELGPSSVESFRRWREYRNRVVSGQGDG
jgi:hypothetical protein